MALTLRRNGTNPKSDAERMSDIRERMMSENRFSQQNAELYKAQLENRINKFELRYEMPSADMVEKVQAGSLQETHDINVWFWTWQTLNRIKGETLTTGTP